MNEKEPREVFSKNLKFLFSKYNIEQNILAEKLGVSPAAITEWVKCRKFPRIDKIQMLANYFNLSISNLLEDNIEMSLTNKSNSFNNDLQLKYGNSILEVLEHYNLLNNLGKEKALENIKDLAEIPKYIEKKTELGNV